MLSQVAQNLPATQYDPVAFAGGFDQITSAYAIPPGVLRDCLNFACLSNGGYYRIDGYERFDGRPAPSDATIIALDIVIAPGKSVVVGDNGMFGNINGTVAAIDPFGNFVTLTQTVATFAYTVFVPGPIVIGGDTKGDAVAVHSNLTMKEVAELRAAAANIYRAEIGPVPGSGPIRGVAYYKDNAYAWRDNAAGTACDIYKSSPAGWVQVAMPGNGPFTNGIGNVFEGDTLTDPAGTQFRLDRLILEEGTWQSGAPSAGRLYITQLTPNPIGGTAGIWTSSSGGTMDVNGWNVVSLAPGGTYNFSIGNFTAYHDTERLYGADGVNDAFEFDGYTLVPIPVEAPYKPKYAVAHSNHLFLAVGSSVIHSALGNPYNFEVIAGAGEIGTGGLITGLLILTGSDSTATLEVTSRNATWILYGTSAADWKFVSYNVGVGALDRTLQNMFDAFSADDAGISMMKQSLSFGNFEAARLTHNIQRFVREMRGQVACSSLSRGRAQYRLYYANGFGIYSTVTPQGLVGHGIVLYPDPVVCAFDGETSTGQVANLFGTNSGYVMWNDKGTSFDGKRINAYLTTNINAVKSPRMRKRFRKLVLEVMGEAYFEMQVGYTFEWASPYIQPHEFLKTAGALSLMPYWDSMLWDAFYWDGKTNDAISVELNGTGENLQLIVVCESDHVAAFTLHSAIFHYTPRRGNR